MAVTWSTWLLRGLRGCYGVYVPLSLAKIALRGSYGAALREGVVHTSSLTPEVHLSLKSELRNNLHSIYSH